MARKRTHCLYCLVISEGPLIFVRFPSYATAMRPLINKLLQRLKSDHGLTARQVHGLEGMAGWPEGEEEPDPDFLIRLEKAYQGAPEIVAKFLLYDWNESEQTFFLARGKSA
jgi:hypothetical protein